MTLETADVVMKVRAVEVYEPLHNTVGKIYWEEWSSFERALWMVWAIVPEMLSADVVSRVKVDRVWRGTAATYVTFNTGTGRCCDCSFGRAFETGREYLVYGTETDGEVELSGCSGKAYPWENSIGSELHRFGVGRPPDPGSYGMPVSWRYLADAVPALLLLGFAWMVRWIRRQRESGSAPAGMSIAASAVEAMGHVDQSHRG